MSLYRPKGAVVEAWCHDGSTSKADQLIKVLGPQWDDYWSSGLTVMRQWSRGRTRILQEARPGSWIVRKSSGEIDVLSSAEFQERYEPVEPGLRA